AALPSQKFGANAAWLRLNVILYNLLSAYQRVGLPEEFHTARPKRLRFLLLNTVVLSPLKGGEDSSLPAIEVQMKTDDRGRSVHRVEDFRFLTGRGRYVEDFTLSGQVHAHVLRSPHAHAAIERIDAAAARDEGGVLGV